MSCDPQIPSLSVTGKIDYCTAKGSCPFVISWTLPNVRNFQCHDPELVAGGPATVLTPSGGTAKFVSIQTDYPITVALNGSGDTFVVNPGGFMATMDVTSLSLLNDLTDPPLDISVSVIFAEVVP